MNIRRTLTLAAALLLALAAQAQDIKPAKDKATKKFGYQDKSKNWVIEPSFDKARRFIDGYAIVEVQGLEGLINATGGWVLRPEYNKIGKFDKLGLCELTVKNGRDKFYGLADRNGSIVIPPECSSLTVSRSEELIFARREGETGQQLWGVYDLAGEEIFAPQFSHSPTFRGGTGTAESALTGLTGLISREGEVLLPFENLAISDGPGQREALTTDFSIRTYDSRLNLTEELRSPGAVKPYDTFGDDVRAAAWHVGCVGRRLHSNNTWAADIVRTTAGRSAQLRPLQLDWGYRRFIRLEPEAAKTDIPGCMEHPYNGKLYTLRAIMYEADGTYVGIASDWGWLEAQFPGGWVYNAEGAEKWLIFDDPNYPARHRGPATVDLSEYGTIDCSDVISGLCLGSYDLKRLQDTGNRIKRELEIIEGENVGVTSYLPHPAPSGREEARLIRDAMRAPVFQNAWHIGEVVNCRVDKRGEEYTVELSDGLICNFSDRFDSPSFSMEGEEVIYWGPNNARTVCLDLEIAGSGCMIDDVYGTGRHLKVLIDMYEEDGSFLRTLGEAPAIDFISDGLIVFEKLGIALKAPGHNMHRGRGPEPAMVIPAEKRLAPALSALPKGSASPTQRSTPRRTE